MNNKLQLRLGAILSYAAIAFNILAGLLYTPWMIKSVGDDQYALYALALSIINIFLLDFGIGSAVTRFLSNYYAHKKFEEANHFMGIVYKVFLAITIGIAVCLFVFYFCIDIVYANLLPSEIQVFKGLFIIVATYSVISFPFITFNGVLMANEKFIEVKACNLGQKVFSVILIICFLLAGKGVYALVLVHAISNAIFLLIKYFLIKKNTEQKVYINSWDKKIAKSLFGYSVWITIINIAQRCIFNIMPTIIAALAGSVQVTWFSLAATLESYVYTFADAINGMFMPKISRILIKEDADIRLTALMSRVGRFHVYSIGLIYIGLVCLGQDFVCVWMGVEYEMIYWCALFLIFPSLIDVPQQVARTSLLVKNVVKQQSIVYVFMAIINLILSFVFIPIIGVVGAAFAICLSYLVRTFGMNILYRKHLPIDLVKYFKQTYSKWLIVAVITLVIGFAISVYVPFVGWIGFVIKAVLVCAVYISLLWLLCLNISQKKEVIKKLKRFK